MKKQAKVKATKIGYSLTQCVRDILDGRVGLDDVEKIIIDEIARTEDHWEFVIYWGCRKAWKGREAEATEIVNALRESGRIEVPRLEKPHYYSPTGLVWAEVGGPDPTKIVAPPPQRRLRPAQRWAWRDDV